jgi:hypothetical protein
MVTICDPAGKFEQRAIICRMAHTGQSHTGLRGGRRKPEDRNEVGEAAATQNDGRFVRSFYTMLNLFFELIHSSICFKMFLTIWPDNCFTHENNKK